MDKTNLVIGSTAIRKLFPDFREPKDVDLFTPLDNPLHNHSLGVGARTDIFWDERLADYFWRGPIDYTGAYPLQWATLDELYTLKVSHAFWDIHNTWNKHMWDVVFLQSKGAQFIRPLYDLVKPIWRDNHGRHRTNLKQDKANFFKDAVVRIYDHDSIHDSVAYGERPMYERVLKPGEEVAVLWQPFVDMTFEDKCKLVREEVYATALERWIIPSNYTVSPRAAYARAMKKTVTSLFKNEWALWIVLNYEAVRDPDMDYVAHHRRNNNRLVLL